MKPMLRRSTPSSACRSANGMRIKPLGDDDDLLEEDDVGANPESRMSLSEDQIIALGVGMFLVFLLTVAITIVVAVNWKW